MSTSDREIDITIDPDGTIHLEAFGFKGQGCHEALEKLRKKLGSLKKSNKKDEFYNKDRISEKERG